MPEPKPVSFDPTTPNVARMYDYYLGGKDNFATDREAAEKALELAPELRVGAREVRKFLTRAMRFLADSGIRQFIDVGCGLPTQGNVHEIAQAAAPEARVAYIDNDPVVIAHARALLENNPLTTVIEADMREPDSILGNPQLNQLVDLSKPVAVLLISVLHVVPDDELAMQIVKRLRDAVAQDSYLAISHAVSDLRPEAMEKLAKLYQDRLNIQGPRRQNLRTKAEVERYFDGLDVVPPGVVYLPDWRPDPEDPAPAGTPVWGVGGIGRRT
jgi:SAM-dependent methyltransferase